MLFSSFILSPLEKERILCVCLDLFDRLISFTAQLKSHSKTREMNRCFFADWLGICFHGLFLDCVM